MGKLNGFAARLERLEQQRNPPPALIVGYRREHETEVEARARTLTEEGITDRLGLPVVILDCVDRDC